MFSFTKNHGELLVASSFFDMFFVAGRDRFFSIAEARLKAAGCNPEVFDLVPGMKQTRRDGRIAWRKSNIFPNMFALSLQWYFPEGIHRVCLC